MQRVPLAAAALAMVAASLPAPARAVPAPGVQRTAARYLVLYAEGARPADARRAIESAGGRVLRVNDRVGLATVSTTGPDFVAAVRRDRAIAGVARDRVIGGVPAGRHTSGTAAGASPDVASGTGASAGASRDAASGASRDAAAAASPGAASAGGGATRRQGGAAAGRAVEREGHGERVSHAAAGRRAVEREGHENGASPRWRRSSGGEPLAGLQWDMKQIHADRAHRYEQGDKRVLVGVMDTGIDASHPDIAPNFDRALSRNFTVDLPYDANGAVLDGPCDSDPDKSCTDPADVDEDGHGTHVASSIAAPVNGLGIAGVAPKVTLVNLRVGQDAGLFFLQPSVDALTYAADNGVDVVNMSFYVDPWLFNCADNPADSPEERLEQRTVVSAMQRALDYAHLHGVTLVASAGNGASDYTKTVADATSPDFASVAGQKPRSRTIPTSCTSMPSEGEHVLDVSATGVSGRKAYYSDYGDGFVDVAAPGGDVYDTPDGKRDLSKATLAAYPKAVAQAAHTIDANGEPTAAQVVKDCHGGVCAYYQYLQGTSMASPRAAGVAALIVSRYGHRDPVHGGLTLSPSFVETVLKGTATPTPCPSPATQAYLRRAENGTVTTVTQTCEGGRTRNGFYGRGVVDALRAVGH